MTGTFSGLNTARTALWANQRALDVTGQNIANVNTAGYSRQRVDLQSLGGTSVPAAYSVSNNVGEGVGADKVARIRDAFLEGRAQLEHAATAGLTVADDTLAQIEQAFREPGASGIQAQLSGMWAAWGDVHNHPTDPAARSEVLQRTATLVGGIHTTRAALDGQFEATYEGLRALVEDVNATASSIAELNASIRRATAAELPTNELVDKRDVLVLKLSAQVGATASPGDDGGITVSVGGATIVSGGSTLRLAVLGSNSPDDLGSNPPRLVTAPGDTPVRAGGTAEGQLTAMTVTLPRYRTAVDQIARQLATDLNAAHARGYDQNGAAGEPVFDDGSGTLPVDVGAITAANLTLRLGDGTKLAASSLAPVPDPAGGTGTVPSADNGNADKLYELSLSTTGTDASYRTMIVGLGVEAATATSRLTTQSVISTQVDMSRESVAGVNLDEEMSNLLQFQHGYAAAGQLVSTINSVLDTLIHMVR